MDYALISSSELICFTASPQAAFTPTGLTPSLELVGQRRFKVADTQNQFLFFYIAGLDSFQQRVRHNCLAVVLGVKAIEQTRGRIGSDAKDDRVRGKVEQKSPVIPSDCTKATECRDRSCSPRFVSQSFSG